jgi:RNA polymerase sigma-70 factor (ECF subfamily)
MHPPRGEITLLLSEVRNGNLAAESRLISFVYEELRRLAKGFMRRERAGHTLQATGLVHEAYLRLLGDRETDWRDRAHFMGFAATIMRRILVEHARERNAGKRGGPNQQRVELKEDSGALVAAQSAEMLDLDRALAQLATVDERLARVVELRYFGGLSVQESAEVLGVSPKTVKRDWAIAKAWLKDEINGQNTHGAKTLAKS